MPGQVVHAKARVAGTPFRVVGTSMAEGAEVSAAFPECKILLDPHRKAGDPTGLGTRGTGGF